MRFLPLALAAQLVAAPALAQELPAAPVAPAPAPAPQAAPAPAAPPPSGLVMLILGSLVTAGGAVVLGATPWCTTRTAEGACIGVSIGGGVAALAVGLPLVIVGANRWRAFEAWAVSPSKAGASLTWRTSW